MAKVQNDEEILTVSSRWV